jgi:hypothetical protein
MAKSAKIRAVLDGVASVVSFGHSKNHAPETARVLEKIRLDGDESSALADDWAQVGTDLERATEQLKPT